MGYTVMGWNEWVAMLAASTTRYLPSRCCGKTIYYRYVGDEWCNDHRCAKVTRIGDRCTRRNHGAYLCAWHFSQEHRELLATA